MKKILSSLLIVVIIMSIIGCGAKEKLEEKVGEKLVEKILEEAGNVDVDINGETIKFKGEDGTEAIFGGTEWPTSELAKSIPEFKYGKIVAVMEMNDSLLITLEEVSKEDFADYLEKIKKTFSQEGYDMKTEDGLLFGAENGEGMGISLIYTTDETLNITVMKV